MRGDRIVIVQPNGWQTDEWMPLPGPGQHRVRFWLADDPAQLTFRLSARPDELRLIGMEVEHLRPDGEWCGGYVVPDTPLVRQFDVRPSGHQVVSVAPLHIEPSLACRSCDSHGWVRNGNWVAA